MIEGRIKTRSWDAPSGEKKYRTEVIAERVQFGPKSGDQESFAQTQRQAGDFSQDRSSQEDVPIVDLTDDNVPPDENIPF